MVKWLSYFKSVPREAMFVCASLTTCKTLANAGITGVMVDVWWGVCERSAQQYNFSAYAQLAQMLQRLKLRMQPIMSFHRVRGRACLFSHVPMVVVVVVG